MDAITYRKLQAELSTIKTKEGLEAFAARIREDHKGDRVVGDLLETIAMYESTLGEEKDGRQEST